MIFIIIKKREVPEEIIFLRRGLVRVPKRRRELELELRNREQGFQAECELDFYLERLGIHSNNNLVALYNLRLPASDGTTFFQIDTLILTPHFGFLIDVKSQSGQFSFQSNARHFQYFVNQRQFHMRHPIMQLDEQRDQLRWWLGSNWGDYPFITLAGLADPHAEILTDSSSDWVHEYVMPFEQVKNTFKRAGEKYTEPLFQKNELVRMGHQLAQAHCPPRVNLAKWFDLVRSDVESGSICPFCNRLAMNRLRVTWECPHCRGRDRTAHVMNLQDFFVFVKPTITNLECREFLGVDKEHTAWTLMNNSGILDWYGHTKGRVYFLKK